MPNTAQDSVNNIKKLIANTVKAMMPTGIYYGTVISEKPIKIDVEQKMTLCDKQLVLSRSVTDYRTELSYDDPAIYQSVDVKEGYIIGDVLDKKAVKNEEIEQNTAKITLKYANTEKVKHKVTVYNSLKMGEKVILMRAQGGQQYVVIDRVGEM